MINISRKYFGIDIKDCKFLGRGREGSVYLTPEGYALKIFNNKNSCESQYNILKKVEGSKYFPKAIDMSGKCLLRKYVEGTALNDYVREHGLPREISIELIHLIEEFQRVGFTRIDVSTKNVFIQNNGEVIVIDPRKSYNKKRDVPGMLLRELESFGALDDLIKAALEIRPDFAMKWLKAVNNFRSKRRSR